MDYTDADGPKMEIVKPSSTSITLTNCNVPLSESSNSTFYFTVPAATYARGLGFTAYNSADEVIFAKATSAPLTVSRSRIASLPGVPAKFIPDANFRARLVDLGFHLTKDGSDIDITNADNITKFQTLPTLDVSTKSGAVSRASTTADTITSLEGIEYFKALTKLTCTGNALTRLDVSANKELVTLECADNTALGYLNCPKLKLKKLNVNNNQNLDTIRCPDNELTTLGLPSSQSQLVYLDCSGNKLTGLDVSKNTALKYLDCASTTAFTGDLTLNTALTYLNCSGIKLKVLKVQSNQNLDTIRCSDNVLTTLDLTQKSQLIYLDCSGNKLTDLDVSANTALKHLDCSGTTLKVLNVQSNQ
ncbi:MAG: leucine-rich repeat domain-containing protein, partial [Acinetobacter sp.]